MITKYQYKKALREISADSRERKAIESIFAFPGHKCSASQMANLAGFTNYGESNLAFGLAGKKVSLFLGINPPRYKPDEPNWWSILADGDNSGREFQWELYPEVVSAIHELGWEESGLPLDHHAGDVIDETPFHEGALTTVRVSIFERSQQARQKCVQHYGYQCIICGFDFQKVYGDIGKDYIHVHHRIPLSKLGKKYIVDPVSDLVPVCPNCHAMLHRTNPPLEIEKLKKLIRPNQTLERDWAGPRRF